MRSPRSAAALAVALILSAAAAPPASAEVIHSSAELLYLVGDVTATHEDGSAISLEVGTQLVAGDTLVTAPDGLASLRLIGHEQSIEHDHMLVSSDTTVVISQVFVDADRKGRNVLLKLLDGLVEIVTAHSGEGRTTIDVETPTAIGGVRGTEFRIAVEPATGDTPVATRVETLDGTVATTAQGVELPVGADFGTRVRDGEAPGPLHPLPPPPALTAPADGDSLAAFEFAWAPVDGAASYVLEIGADAEFHKLLQRETVSSAGFAPESAALPIRAEPYHWRVSVVDSEGFQGRPSAPRAFVLATP